MKSPPAFPGSDRVLSHFGYWPRFHDAKLLSCELNEAGSSKNLDLVMHAFSMTKEVDAKGYFILDQHCLVHIRFHEVEPLDLSGFNTSNIFFELELNQVDPNWEVHASMVIERDLNFTCRYPEIISLVCCDAKGKKL